LCRFVPFWLESLAELDRSPAAVLSVRSPLDVARSLRRRDGLPIAHGLLLWLRHVLDAEVATRTRLRSVVLWSDFHLDWRQSCEKIGHEIGVAWPCLNDSVSSLVDRFLCPDLVHFESSQQEIAAHSQIHDWILAAFDLMTRLARGSASQSSFDGLDDIRHRFDEASILFGRALSDDEETLSEIRARSIKKAPARAALAPCPGPGDEIAQLREQAQSSVRSMAEAQARAEKAECELREQRAIHQPLRDAAEAASAENVRLRAAFERLAAERAGLEFQARRAELATARVGQKTRGRMFWGRSRRERKLRPSSSNDWPPQNARSPKNANGRQRRPLRGFRSSVASAPCCVARQKPELRTNSTNSSPPRTTRATGAISRWPRLFMRKRSLAGRTPRRSTFNAAICAKRSAR
jgi:hypothetical protein